jgi:hypothetical protein
MDHDKHPQLMTFSQAALLVPRAVLSHAVDDKRLTLYRRKRTLLLARAEVPALRQQASLLPSGDLSILDEER